MSSSASHKSKLWRALIIVVHRTNSRMPVARRTRQFVIVDRPPALAGRPANWRETDLCGKSSYRTLRTSNIVRSYGSRVRKIVNCMLAFGFAVRDETVQNRLAELPVPQQIPSSTNDLAETVTILDVLRSTLMPGCTSFGGPIAISATSNANLLKQEKDRPRYRLGQSRVNIYECLG